MKPAAATSSDTPPLIQCIYASAATRHLDPADIPGLLTQARDHNRQFELTGMLLYAQGSFFQVLEGPLASVDALYARIETDQRHDHVTLIIREPIVQRSFKDWTMGFKRVTTRELAAIDGVNDFFHAGRSLSAIDAGRARKLLSAFRDGRWHLAPPTRRLTEAA